MWFEEIASYICFIVSTFKVLFFECKRQICSKGTKAQPTVLWMFLQKKMEKNISNAESWIFSERGVKTKFEKPIFLFYCQHIFPNWTRFGEFPSFIFLAMLVTTATNYLWNEKLNSSKCKYFKANKQDFMWTLFPVFYVIIFQRKLSHMRGSSYT